MKDIMSKAQPKDDKAEAKMKVLHELREMAMGMMGDKLAGKMPTGDENSVTVAAPDKKGLKEGLSLASGLLPGHDDVDALPHDEDSSEVPAALSHDAADEMDEDDEEMSPEEIDEMIEHLQAKKSSMGMKR